MNKPREITAEPWCRLPGLTTLRPVETCANAESARNTIVGVRVRPRMRNTLALPRLSTLVSGAARSVLRVAGWGGHVLYGLLAPAWLGIEPHQLMCALRDAYLDRQSKRL